MLAAAEDSQDWLAMRAHLSPAAPALLWEGEWWSYAELNDHAQRDAEWLAGLGVEPGQGVALLSPNSRRFVSITHALARLGALLIPLNTRLSAPELTRQLTLAGPRLLLFDATMREVAAAIELPGLGRQAIEERPPALPGAAVRSFPTFRVTNLQAAVFTSGSSGAPKAALLTYENHFWSAVASAFRLGCLPEDRWLACLPLYHVGGLAILFRSCLYGSAVVLQAGFDLPAINRSLDEDGVTIISLVPTMLHRLLNARSGWPGSLRLALIGGAAASSELIERARAAGVPLALTYGLTEAASQVATMPPGGVRDKPGSVGKPLSFTRLRIVDAAGHDLPRGEPGDIVVSGPTVMTGYLEDERATAATLRDGELYTGDIGFLDEDGDLWLLQRRADLIISGGENIYPAEVEAVLRAHPGVAEACVVGLPDTEWGQLPAALVVPRPGEPLTVTELDELCRRVLAGYKRPRRFLIASEMPLTASGKPARQEVHRLMANLDT